MAHHPPHPQFLDPTWPQPHDTAQSQPLQLENEYDIDPTRYSILQSDLQIQPPHNVSPGPPQGSGFNMNHNYERPQFGGTGDYTFTFPNPQSQQFSQLYGNELYTGSPQFPQMAHQSIPSSPYYHTDTPAFTYGQDQSHNTVGQHNRTESNPNPGPTPTMRSFQGDPHRTPIYSNAPSPIPPNFGLSENHGLSPGVSYQDQGYALPHSSKRMRLLDDGEGEVSSVEGDGQDEGGVQAKEEGAKPTKPPGACARCKGLKVKCEFKTDPDICRRCLNGGHECVIPGRKKRRAPPRRDVLLSQIREQATKIEELMKQLEEANKRASLRPIMEPANAPSPSHSASTTDNPSSNCSEWPTSEFTTPETGQTQVTKPDVLDWIAKARQSIEAFGGYINMGGPSVTKDMLGEDVLGWRESDSDEDFEGGDEQTEDDEVKSDIHLEVEDVDGKHYEVEIGPPRGRARSEEDTNLGTVGDPPTGDDVGSSVTQSSHRKKTRGRERLAILPNEAAPIGMLANLSLRKSRRKSRSRSASPADDNEYGVASDDYFRANSPGPDRPIMYEQHQTPYILRSGLVNPTEVEKLFKTYFDYLNMSISLLDPVLYTAQKTYWRSPLLFTVSEYYMERPELYQQAMNCARLSAGSNLIGGQKSIETVAAYLLLGLYPVPARKWEEDRCWVYTGLAIRIATDLNLHLPHNIKPKNEQHAREALNRTRVWINCFNVDRSFSSQYGKTPMISNTDYIANHSEFFYKSSQYNIPGFDIHLCGYCAELRTLADYRFRVFSDPQHPVGLNKDLDVTVEASKTDDKLANLWETWLARINEENNQSIASQFRTRMLKVAVSYARMNVLSFAFQHTFKRSQGFDDAFFWRCLRAAKDILGTLVDDIGLPQFRKFLRHGPEAHCVFSTFTCAFLIKLLNPKYAVYIPRDTRVEIRTLVEEVAELLGHPDVAVDDRHGPKMYSTFLKGLLDTPLARVDHSPAALKRATRVASASPDADSVHDRTSPSPLPPTSVSSFLSPGGEGGIAGAVPVHHPAKNLDSLGLDYVNQQPSAMADLYAPSVPLPLPFDSELLHSMQSLTESTWSSMILPGFSWMDAMQQDSDDVTM